MWRKPESLPCWCGQSNGPQMPMIMRGTRNAWEDLGAMFGLRTLGVGRRRGPKDRRSRRAANRVAKPSAARVFAPQKHTHP